MKNTKKNDRPSRVVAYFRVSTDKQADDGNSLLAQRAKVVAYAELYDLEIVDYLTDTASASSLERPGLQSALLMLETGQADGLLVAKLDRLTRSVRDLCDLVDEYFRDECSLLSVGENIDTRSASGRMLLNVLTSIGQWERETIGARTAAVMQHMRATGMFTGGFPPYGYRVAGDKLEAVTEELNLVERARYMRTAGESLRAIAKALGFNPRTGKPFAASQIARML
jgi:DNA invertase Pin-like site-specific DNA recombinase